MIPHALKIVAPTLPPHIEHALHVIRTRLARRPLPAAVATLSSHLEYRAFSVLDPDAIAVDAEQRLGRHIGDVLPVDLTEVVLEAIYTAQRTHAAIPYQYVSLSGATYTARVTIVHRDRIELMCRRCTIALLVWIAMMPWVTP